MSALSWDLHVHPGPSRAPRWGDGRRVWDAARVAGVAGFVWKSHEEHTVDRCLRLPAGPPVAIPSASLNPWARLEDSVDAIDRGAAWLWGPTCDEAGRIAWELPLPGWWPELRARVRELRRPLVLATGHLGPDGRAELAETAREVDGLRCSVTHSLHVRPAELRALARAGCLFELDLYTYVHPLPGRWIADVGTWAQTLAEEDAFAYVTSDGGQAHTGNPFEFARRVRARLERELEPSLVERLCRGAPAELARDVLESAELPA
jgi:Family of unknown function (DUF6282)